MGLSRGLVVKTHNGCLLVEATGVIPDYRVTVTWDSGSANAWYFERVLTTAHRAVAVHLRLTLKALSLSEFIALHVQIAGFTACIGK